MIFCSRPKNPRRPRKPKFGLGEGGLDLFRPRGAIGRGPEGP